MRGGEGGGKVRQTGVRAPAKKGERESSSERGQKLLYVRSCFFVVVAILHSYSSTTQIGVLIIIECNHVVNLLLLRWW